MESFAEYGHAITSLVVFAVIVLALSPFSALAKQKGGMVPGATPAEDYSDRAYRLNRAYLNGTETLPAFLTVTVAAMLAGVDPSWVNALASVFLVSRILMLVVHLAGVGAPHSGLRSITYVLGWACLVVIAALTLVAVL
jgi:uncharacterized MAPEG superfamily protein